MTSQTATNSRHIFGVFLILALLCTAATGSPIRVATMGGESRLLEDETNVYIYPALVGSVPHAAIELFDDWVGVALPIGGTHSAGLFLNRPSPQLERFNDYLANDGSDLFRSLDVRPWIDILYGTNLSDQLRFGLAARLSVDREEDSAGGEAAASETDVRFGVGLGTESTIDLAVGLRRLALEDNAGDGLILEETGGDGIVVDVRWRMKAGAEGLIFTPFATWETTSVALQPSERDENVTRIGLGLNAWPAPSVLALFGVAYEQSKVVTQTPGLPPTEEVLSHAPVISAGSEVQVGSMLFRLGVRHLSSFTETTSAGTSRTSFEPEIEIAIGIGLEFGDLMLNGHLERDFLRDGPHLIGGSRHGGGIFSRIGLTYRL